MMIIACCKEPQQHQRKTFFGESYQNSDNYMCNVKTQTFLICKGFYCIRKIISGGQNGFSGPIVPLNIKGIITDV